MNKEDLRVVLVDDSLMTRKWLSRFLEKNGGVKVVGEAGNGRAGLEVTSETKPDVVIMDMAMPELDGVGATRLIMEHCPTPIVILSAEINRPKDLNILEGLSHGAVQVVEKPKVDDDMSAWKREFMQTLFIAADTNTELLGHLTEALSASEDMERLLPANPEVDLVLIAGSSGGPMQISKILSELPVIHAPVLVQMQTPPGLSMSLVDIFKPSCMMPVLEADELMSLGRLKGRVVLSPAGKQIQLSEKMLRLKDYSDDTSKLSLDSFFSSATEYEERVLGILLPGAQKDGFEGLAAIQRSGGYTVLTRGRHFKDGDLPAGLKKVGPPTQILDEEGIAETIANYAGGDFFTLEL